MSVRWITVVWDKSPYKGERLLLHLALADYANDEGTCFPSQRTLAHKARCSENFVSVCLKQMVEDGYLAVQKEARGRGRTATYLLKKPHLRNGDLPNGDLPQPETPFAETITPHMNRNEPSITQEFEKFWSAYPRKVGKGAARKAFAKALIRNKNLDMQMILDAVAAYASTIKDMQYCAHPTTWLVQERWADIEDAKPTKVVVTPPRISNAQALGNVSRLTGTSKEEFEDRISHLPLDEQQAARVQYER